MLPKSHLLLGTILVSILFLFFPWVGIINLILVLLSTTFIDVDHYFYYIFKKRNLNLITAYKWYMNRARKFHSLSVAEKKKLYHGFLIFHGFESLLILFLLGFFVSKIFYFILTGFSFHLFLDIFIEAIYYDEFNKISILYNLIKKRKLKLVDDLD